MFLLKTVKLYPHTSLPILREAERNIAWRLWLIVVDRSLLIRLYPAAASIALSASWRMATSSFIAFMVGGSRRSRRA